MAITMFSHPETLPQTHPLAMQNAHIARYYRNLIKEERNLVYTPRFNIGILAQEIVLLCANIWNTIHNKNKFDTGEAMHFLLTSEYKSIQKHWFCEVADNERYRPPIKIQNLLAQYPASALQHAHLIETPVLAPGDCVIAEINKSWKEQTKKPQKIYRYHGYASQLGDSLFPMEGTWIETNPYKIPNSDNFPPQVYQNLTHPPLHIYVNNIDQLLQA